MQMRAAALAISSRGYVLETGRIAPEDAAGALLRNIMVVRACLGACTL